MNLFPGVPDSTWFHAYETVVPTEEDVQLDHCCCLNTSTCECDCPYCDCRYADEDE
jgi:hypothetical protein